MRVKIPSGRRTRSFQVLSKDGPSLASIKRTDESLTCVLILQHQVTTTQTTKPTRHYNYTNLLLHDEHVSRES